MKILGTGIRVADINQIKQYAEDKEYEKALVLIRQQDLSKTFNSQFARICGEVLLYTKNYEESRYALINAHKMAPEGNRIDYDLIMLYLETGELALAEKYYEQYVFNAGEEDHDLCWLNYHMARSKHSPAQVLYDALAPMHTPDRSDELAFEFMKIYRLMGDQTRFDEEYQYWKDTFRDSIYKEQIEQLIEIENIEKELYTYPDTSVLKHDAQIDALEESLLEQDYFRMYPKEPEIVLMADDYDAQDDQSYMLKIKMDKWSQKRREKAEKRAAAKAERKQAKQDKKDAGKTDEKAAKAEGTEKKPEEKAAETEIENRAAEK
ncbi:MAG: hypothetical protein K2G89_05825 [Lachnospiraceae bacterium]|nr:hypothetical protein [Lachnospiraceae bacterium]